MILDFPVVMKSLFNSTNSLNITRSLITLWPTREWKAGGEEWTQGRARVAMEIRCGGGEGAREDEGCKGFGLLSKSLFIYGKYEKFSRCCSTHFRKKRIEIRLHIVVSLLNLFQSFRGLDMGIFNFRVFHWLKLPFPIIPQFPDVAPSRAGRPVDERAVGR